MILQTGGFWLGPISTRSRPASNASASASSVAITEESELKELTKAKKAASKLAAKSEASEAKELAKANKSAAKRAAKSEADAIIKKAEQEADALD